MGKKWQGLGVLLLGLGILLGASQQVRAQSGAEVSSLTVGHDFGEEIRFRVQIESSNPIKEVLVLFRDVREDNTRIFAMNADGDEFTYTYDASNNLLNPFAELSLWFQIRLENGEEFTSKKYAYIYTDDRFSWETRADGNLRVHWGQGDESFGQGALDTARNSLANIQRFFPADDSQPIDIYIYASPTDLQNALFMGGESWVAGHASPALGIVFVSIAPSTQEKIIMQQQIPHELAHVLLYRYVGEGYNRLPTWLLEGIASLAELYPNPDYELALERAVDQNTLIPIKDLCAPFSRDASQAFLSYAEAASFTRYLHSNYGITKLDNLIRTYADGVACDVGAADIYGQPLAYLDAHWQESVLGANLLGVAFRATMPYLLLLAIFLAYPATQLFTGKPKQEKDDR